MDEASESVQPGWVELDGAVNVRDLGGMPAAGGVTRKGVLLRGDNMANLSENDVARLVREIGVVRLIDLRSPGELAESGPSPLCASGVVVNHLPLMVDADLKRRGQTLRAVAASEKGLPFANGYDEYLHVGKAPIAAAFQILADDDGAPALIHCTAGRDRTGVLCAIMLDAVNVDRRWIVADYAATAHRVEALAGRLAKLSAYERQAAKVTAAGLTTKASTMAQFLSLLDAQFGGTAAWLRQAGVPQQALDRWADRLVARA